MKINLDNIKQITYTKSFDAIRIILNSSDAEFSKFLQTPDIALITEIIFVINKIFPNGLDGAFKLELGKTLSRFDTLQITLSFLNSIVEDENINNLIEDTRMSIQNFCMFLNFKSYYSAFFELRKVLESLIWFKMLELDIEFLNNNQRLDNSQSYKKLFQAHFPELLILYQELSRLSHVQKKKAPVTFNINDAYQQKDYLFDYLSLIDQNWETIYNGINNILNIVKPYSKTIINRYQKLLEILYQAEAKLKLKNYPISKTSVVEIADSQKTLSNIIASVPVSDVEMNNIENHYRISVNYIPAKIIIDVEKDKNAFLIKIAPFKDGSQQFFSYWDNVLNQIFHQENHQFDNLVYFEIIISKSIRRSHEVKINVLNVAKHYHKIIGLCTTLLVKLFNKEMRSNGSKKIAILRSYLEEIIYNIYINKIASFGIFNLIRSFLLINYQIKWNSAANITTYRHIQFKDRLSYHSIENNKIKTTGSVNMKTEVVPIFIDMLNFISDNLENIN